MAKKGTHATAVTVGPLGAVILLSLHQAQAFDTASSADEVRERPDRRAIRGAVSDDRRRACPGNAFERSVINATLSARIRTLLLANNKTIGKAIDVRSKDGIVSLAGTVHSEVEKEFAARIARSAGGVKAIRNHLCVNSG